MKLNAKLDTIVYKICDLTATKTFFAFTIVLSAIPCIYPALMTVILFISNTFQLLLLPVILIAWAYTAKIQQIHNEKILLKIESIEKHNEILLKEIQKLIQKHK